MIHIVPILEIGMWRDIENKVIMGKSNSPISPCTSCCHCEYIKGSDETHKWKCTNTATCIPGIDYNGTSKEDRDDK